MLWILGLNPEDTDNMKQAPPIIGPRKIVSKTAQLFAPLLWLMVPGTGSAFSPEGLVQLERWAHQGDLEIRPIARQADAHFKIGAQHAQNIRDKFGLNMSDLALLLHVSRPTVYAWLKGQSPQADAFERLSNLSTAADRFAELGISRPETVVKARLSETTPLLELLIAADDPLPHIEAFSKLIEKSNQARRESKGSGKRLRPIEQVSGLSAPATHEPN